MKRKLFLGSLILSSSLFLISCGQEAKEETDTQSSTAQNTTETEEQVAATDSRYLITEEASVSTQISDNQPISSYWFPETLLSWTPEEDPDFLHNQSTVPLATRIENEFLVPSNDTQVADYQVMAISVMNASTSGNAPRGLNNGDVHSFTFWQYVDLLVYWGGSAGEGIIVPPSPDVTDLAHKNGVPVLGTIFFPPATYGGSMEWLELFLQQEDDGSFPMADKLVEVATLYRFDGWFINQETEGTAEQPLTSEHAELMVDFIEYFKETATDLHISYYDAMTINGELAWQNTLNEENSAFLISKEGEPVADDMFLNFWWTNNNYVKDQLLRSSKETAETLDIDPYSLFAGIDVQANGNGTAIRWDVFTDEEHVPYTSLGLYCPSWTYYSAESFEEFQEKELDFWVNRNHNPREEIDYSADIQWRGISTYKIEESAITSLPFITNFNIGSGYDYYKQGELISHMDWNNRSIGDILPSYRYIIENGAGNNLEARLSDEDSYYGAHSLCYTGSMETDSTSNLILYKCALEVEADTLFTTIAKANTETKLDALISFQDGSTALIPADTTLENTWTNISYDLSAYVGKVITEISYQVSSLETKEDYQLSLGNISLYQEQDFEAARIENLQIEDVLFDEEGMHASIRLSFTSDVPASYYEIYKVNTEGKLSLLGVTNQTHFYLNQLARDPESLTTSLMVLPVNGDFTEGTAATVELSFPDASLPNAAFTASDTYVGTGSSITFTSKSSANTETVTWNLEGSSQTSATGTEVTVSYDRPGTYPVTITATNEAGETTYTSESHIVVSDGLEANATLPLLSADKPVSASSFVHDGEADFMAVDGDFGKKWCATGPAPHSIIIDLEDAYTLSSVVVSHAEAGGEGASMNTMEYHIYISEDGENFTQVVEVTDNQAGTTKDSFPPIQGRYVKFEVIKATQGTDSAARIYEIEVYGVDTN